MAFRVGQKVVCVDAERKCGDNGLMPLRRSATYTIRGFCHIEHEDAGSGLHLEEIYMYPDDWHPQGEPCFDSRRFRPIVETKTDISIFRRLVTPKALTKFKERVDA